MTTLDHPSRPGTPPHQPNAGVHMPKETVERICSLRFPGSQLISIQALSTLKSYNNRIYFLELQHIAGSQHAHDLAENATQTYVLKVNGRFWGAEKVHNEVLCLGLLQSHCPGLPTPVVFAWSGDGRKVQCAAMDESLDGTQRGLCYSEGEVPAHGGWILMSKKNGQPIPTEGLDDETYEEFGRQLAVFVASWRRQIPLQGLCGNIAMAPIDDGNAFNQPEREQNADSIVVQGLLMDNVKTSEPLSDPRQYYKARMLDKMESLRDSDTYTPNRHMLPILQKFLDNDLPNLKLKDPAQDHPQGYFLFTHYDLSPRNILVTLDPPQITGIVDFEFAGFFSPFEEFLNDYIGNDGDWPAPLYAAYQQQLEENGIPTPIGSMSKTLWNRNYWLESMMNYIAPWWLPGKHQGESLARELREAERLTLASLMKVLAVEADQTPTPEYGKANAEGTN